MQQDDLFPKGNRRPRGNRRRGEGPEASQHQPLRLLWRPSAGLDDADHAGPAGHPALEAITPYHAQNCMWIRTRGLKREKGADE